MYQLQILPYFINLIPINMLNTATGAASPATIFASAVVAQFKSLYTEIMQKT